ncbi:MAG TPA: histidine ammonia-lyase [Ktedonobacteraceae bacterium]|jgi:histidine ammonia-lyase
MGRETHYISLKRYTLDDFRLLLETRPYLKLDREVEEKIALGAEFVQAKAKEDRYIYGVNTGFGSLCETRVDVEEMQKLQYNIIVSHAVGIGEMAAEEVSRLTLLIKLLTFRTGHTGISLSTVYRLLEYWNNDIIPATPYKGTVGASGDLAPLAHMALTLFGEGKVYVAGKLTDSAQMLREKGWEPVTLQLKEGLALINGVQYIAAIAVYSLIQIEELIMCAEIAAAMSIQGFSASRTFYQREYDESSYHQDRHSVAANLRKLLEKSNHFELPHCNKANQDPYSLRCTPQVHAAVRQTVRFARQTIEDDCNSVGDNPLFFAEYNLILSGGNLHGESVAMMLDFLAIATSELASIAERRTYQLLSGQRGLPSYLVKHSGLNSGFMVAQYTSAALVNENKVLSTPACVDTIPTSQLQEDHVSMGGTAAYKLCQIIENCEYVLAIELLVAAQAVQLNEGLRLSPITEEILRSFRQTVSFLEHDRIVSEDINKAHHFVQMHRRTWYGELQLQQGSTL